MLPSQHDQRLTAIWPSYRITASAHLYNGDPEAGAHIGALRVTNFFARNLKKTYPMIESGHGSWVSDTQGKSYLDGCSGAVAANIGHGIASINEAIKAQLDKISFAHTSQFVSEPALRLSELLIGMAPANFRQGRVYYVSGGSEAVETSIKLARAYFLERDGQSGKHLIVSRWNSYHGNTQGAMAVTGHPARRKPYFVMLKDQPHINPTFPYRCQCGAPGNCIASECGLARANELEATILKVGAENVAAFIAEPVVGAALGAVAAHEGYWKRIREICDQYDVLFIADEVMTGIGRCGANFAMDLYDVEPDLIVAGKGLAAGYMPLAAVLASNRIVEPFLAERSSGAFEHGFTYSGHPLSCAAGLAVVEYVLQNKLVESVSERSEKFLSLLEEMKEHEIVGDARRTGFLGALEFVADGENKEPFPREAMMHRKVADAALEQGLLVYPGSGFIDGLLGDHVIIAPPINISEEDLVTVFEKLSLALAQISRAVRASGRPISEVAKA